MDNLETLKFERDLFWKKFNLKTFNFGASNFGDQNHQIKTSPNILGVGYFTIGSSGTVKDQSAKIQF